MALAALRQAQAELLRKIREAQPQITATAEGVTIKTAKRTVGIPRQSNTTSNNRTGTFS